VVTPYLLEESNESHTALMDPQPIDPQQIAAMFTNINAKLDTLQTFEERLTIVDSTRDQTLPRNNRCNNTDNTSNPDAQYLKKHQDRYLQP